MDLYSSQEIQQNYARRSAEREANRDRYMTELTDTDFRLLNETYGEESDDEEYANRRYRAAAAFKLARMYNLPPPEAETYLDDFIKAEFPRADSPKTAWKAVADSFALGANQKRLAALGLRLMTLPEGEARNTLWQEIEAIGKENMELKDEVQRGWVLEGLKGFGTSWAFTASAAGAGFLGSLGTPALGIASAAAVSAADMTGLEFVNLLSEGVDWETARNTAIASGTIQGVLEAFIGDIPALGSRTGLGQLIFRKLHYAGKFGAAARVLGARAIDSVMEGVEELAQEKVSQIGTERAKQATEQKVQGLIAQGKPWDEAAADLATAAFEEYYRATSESGDHGNKLRRDTPEELDRALRESFRVGFLTSLVTGVPIIGRDIHASMTDLKKLKAAADTAPTFDAYKKLTEKNPALQAFNETNKTAIQEQLFSSAQERRKQEEAAIAEELRKSRLYGGADSSEGAAYRGEDGAPYVERQEHTGSDGITTGEFAMGNPQMTENNTYARAPYTVSGERIVIERVRMAESREALRPEFLQVIANSVNQEVVWEGETYTPQADGARAARIGMERQARQTAAPAERFTATERRIFERLKKVMPEIRNDAEGKAIAEQVKFHAALNNLTAEQYIEKRFEPGITTETDANTLAAAQKVSGRQKGATTFNPETGKALIAGSTWADFSTASHEFAHVLRRQLQGDLLAEAERVYGVTDGIWTGDREEAFARGYEKYLEAGEAPTPKLADLFRKLKDFMGRIYAIVKNEHILTDGQKALFDRIFREAQTNLEAMENAGTQPGAAGNIREGGGPRHTEELGLFQADMTPEDRVINDETAGFTERARAVVDKAGKAYAWEMLAEEDKAHLATGGLLVRAMKIRGPAAREAVMEAIRALRKRYAGTEAEYKAPNGKPSLLIEALGEERGRQAWYAVRTPSFKDWFGDWERAARIAQLEKSPNLKLDGNAYEGKYDISGTPKENHKSITAYLKSIAKNEKLGNSYVSEPIRLGNDGIDKMTSYGMSNLAYMKSIAHIPTLLKNAVLITEESPRKSVAHYYAYKHLATGFEMNGEKYTAHIVLGENAGIWYYQHNLSQIEKGTLVEVIRGTNSGLQDSLLDTVKDTTLIGILQAPDTSKVIDANGEPLAVFHGTGTAFDVFSNESGLEAYYFTAEKHRADTYAKMKGDQGGIVMPVFLNVKKPVELDAEEFKKDNIENYSVEYDGAINRWAHAYAVFSPTQIKSATDNAGTFSNENPSILFQTIGERGAAALDRAEEATTRLDNLAIARQMEAAGKDAKAVRLATGWERGADGKWRYEIGDGFHFDLSQLNMAGSFEGRLDAILSHDELFAAYPKLRDTKLTVNSQEQLKQFFGVPYAGAYSEEENWIRINYQTLERGRIENTDSIFIHEIQHAIQSMEGFSYGSNTVHFDTLFSDTEDITDFLELDKEYRQYREKKKLAEWLVMPENFRRIKSPAIKNIVNQFRNGELGKFEAGDKLWEFHQQHYENIRKKRDAYERTAGEVEARNVQARMGFTPQQRLETLLEETEDVRREDQLFLAEGARTGAAMAMGEERRTAAVVDIDPEIIVDESGKPIDLKNTRELVTWIRKQYQGKEVTISDGGLHLTLTRWGLESSAKKRGEKHHQAYAGLERLIETALYDSYEEGDKVHPNVEKQNIYYAAVRINDALYSVRLKIDIPTDKSNPNYYKDHKITEIEIAPSLYQGSSVTGPSLQDESAITEISLAVLKGEVNASRIEGAALFQGALLEAYYAEHPGTRERVERFLAMAESDEGLLGMARVFNALEADGGDTPARQAYRKIFGAKNWDVLMRKAARGETITARDRERLRRQLRYAPLVYTDAWAAVTGDPSFAIPVPEETALPHDDSLAVFMRNDAGIVAYSQQFASPEEFQTAYEEWDIIIKQPEGMQEAAAAGKFYKTIWEEGRKLKAEPAETVETGERGVEDFLAMVNSETGLFSMVRDLRGVKEGLRDFQPDSAEEGQRYTAEKRALDTVFGGKNNNWNNAMIQADRDGVIHSTTKTFIRGQVRKNPLPYMEAWAVVTGDDSWLAGKADKGKYSRLDAGDDLEGMTGNESPEERRRIARRIAYEGVEEAIANGTLKPDDPRLDDYEEELRERQKQGQAKIARKKEDLSDFQWHIEKAEANIKKQQLLAAGLADDTTREGLTKTRKQEAGVKQAQNDLLRLRKEYAQWAASLDAMGRKNLAEFRELLEEQAETEESLRAIDDFRKARIRVARELLRKPDSKTIRKYERDIIRWIQGRFPALYESLPKFIGPKARSVYEMVAAFFSDETYRTKIQTTMSAENYKKLEVIIWSNKHKNERRPYDKMTAKQRETLYNLMAPWEELHLFGIDNIEDRTQNQSTPAQEKWVREQLEPLIPPHIMAKLENFQGLETYTMEELETLAEAVRGLRKKGWDELRIRNDARKQFYEAYQDAFGKIIRDSFKGKVKGRQLPGTAAEKIGDEEASRFKKLLYLNTNARRFVRMLEGGTDGLMYDVITEGEDRAYYQQMTRERERRERVAARLKEAGIDPRVLSRHTFEVAVDLDGKGIKTAAITLDEGLSIRRAALNERAYRAVMFGNFGTVDERTAALEAFERMDYTGSIASLARAESRFDAAKKQIDAFLAEHPELTKVEEILGQDFDEHYGRLSDFVADEFNQDLGSESYYMPLIRLEQNGTDINQENVDDVFAEAGIKQYISRGFTRGRIDVADFAQQPVKLGLYKLWDEAVTKQEHLMAYAPHLREMRGIFQEGIRSKQLMNDIRERYSIEGKKYIDNYISTLANPNPQKSYNNLDGINRLVRGYYPTAVLAFRVSSIIKQAITSPPPFFQAGIGVMEYTAAAMECLNPDTRRMIVEKSLFMYSRVWEPAVAAMKQMEKMSLPGKAGKAEAALTTVEKIGMEGLSRIDRAAVFPGWLAAYRKKTAELSRNKTMTEELIEADAVRYADRVVRDSQPSNRTVDLAPLFQRDRGGAFGQFFLQFQVPMSVIFQNIFIDAPNNFKNGRIREGVTTIAVYALTAALVGILEEDEDDEKLNPKYRGIDAATGMLESIPVVGGSIAYSVEGLLRTGKMGMSGFRPFPVIESGVKGINGITQGEWGKALDGAIEMFGYWASLPVGAKREWQRAIKEKDLTIPLGNK